MSMVFIETPIFTKEITDLMPDENYQQLQQTLIISPSAGKIIPGSNGLRKLRWNLPGIGKRGGVRIIYYWYISEDTIFMLFPYRKSKQEDLTKKQIKILSNTVKEYLK